MADEYVQRIGVYLGPSPLTLSRDSTEVTVDTTVTETDLISYSVDAGQIVGDSGNRLTVDLVYKNNSGSTEDFTFRAYFGATELWEYTVAVPDSANEIPQHMVLELMGNNSDTAQEFFGHHGLGGGYESIYGTSAEDATLDVQFRVTVEMSVADADAWVTLRRIYREQL